MSWRKVVGGAIVAVLMAGMFWQLPAVDVDLNQPPAKGVTIDKIADGALSDPRIWDRGIRNDTAAICIVFDDGHDDWYDSTLVWNEELGFAFGFAVPRTTIGADDTLLTAAEVQALYANRNEILNHFWAKGDDYYMTHVTGDTLDAMVNDTYRYLVDTLGVGIVELPGEIGAAYAGGHIDYHSIAEVAENHFYGIYGGYCMENDYEADWLDANGDFADRDKVWPNNKWWRYWGSQIPYLADTLKASDKTFNCKPLIFQNAVPNRWAHPVGYSNGPAVRGGTILHLAQARQAVRHAIHNHAALIFSFHKDLTALNGAWSADADSCAWFSEWVWWLKSMQDSGLVTVKRPYEICRDWTMRPMKTGVNLFPNPDLQKTSNWQYVFGKAPLGFSYGGDDWNSSPNSDWQWEMNASGGFRNSACGKVYPGSGNDAQECLMYWTRVPGNCYVYWSAKLNAYDAFDEAGYDSVQVRAYIMPLAPALRGTTLAGDNAGNAAEEGSWHYLLDGGSNFPSAFNGAFAYRLANTIDFEDGFRNRSRWFYDDEDFWKEVSTWQFIESPTTVAAQIVFGPTAATPDQDGTNKIGIDDVTFIITRTPPPGY